MAREIEARQWRIREFPRQRMSQPELEAFRAELIEAMEYSFSQLTVEQRQAVMLLYYEGMSLQEAAGQSNCSVEAVRSRFRRARSQLCQHLNHLKP